MITTGELMRTTGLTYRELKALMKATGVLRKSRIVNGELLFCYLDPNDVARMEEWRGQKFKLREWRKGR